MQYLIQFVTYILDMVIITAFLQSVLKTFRKTLLIPYIASLVVVELFIYACETIIHIHTPSFSVYITTAVSVITTFLLCLFFRCSMKARLLAAISFQVLVFLGEAVFTVLINQIHPEIFETSSTSLLYIIMNTGSKIMLLLLCLVVSFLFKKQRDALTIEYNVLLFITPFVSLIIFMFVPLDQLYTFHNITFHEILFVSLIVLNIINYILIQRTHESARLQILHTQMEQQLAFQKDKLIQLSESYRQGRRIIHDIKKQYYCIQEYISKEEYEGLRDFTKDAIHDLESTYVRYNTGNLVIDSFLTNYDTLAAKNSIPFSASLNVNYNRVPINDYDLCVILGNILDNSMNACKRTTYENRFIHIQIDTTDNNQFIILCTNSSPTEPARHPEKDSLEHGLGLGNIQRIVDRNHGLVSYQDQQGEFRITVVIPILDKQQRSI